MQALAPNLYTELEGIAAGAGGEVTLLDIVALNARSEIALANNRVGLGDGCTSLAWALPDGRQVLAQNWDWMEEVAQNLALVSIEQPGTRKPKIWMVLVVRVVSYIQHGLSVKPLLGTFQAGMVAKIGFNSASVGICINAIRANALSTSHLPFHFLMRIALECTSVSEVIATFEKLGGPASSQHILVADASSARSLEVSPKGTVVLRPDADGVVAHTNHFVENQFVEDVPWLSNSRGRLARALSLVDEIRKELTTPKGMFDADDVMPEVLRARVFSDKEGAPEAICCEVRTPTGSTVGSLFNIVIELGRNPNAEVLFGRPAAGKDASVYRMPW